MGTAGKSIPVMLLVNGSYRGFYGRKKVTVMVAL
jgi:hypothetical protein